MKVRLGGLPHEASQLPCVTLADVESVLSAWTGIPTERMSQDDRNRLALMEPALKVRHHTLLVPAPCTQPWPLPTMLWIQSGALGGIWELRWLIAIDGAKWATSLLTLTSGLAVLQIRSASQRLEGRAWVACQADDLCHDAGEGDRAGGRGERGGAGHEARAQRPEGPAPPHRGHALRGAHRRRQDRAHQGAPQPVAKSLRPSSPKCPSAHCKRSTILTLLSRCPKTELTKVPLSPSRSCAQEALLAPPAPALRRCLVPGCCPQAWAEHHRGRWVCVGCII